VHGQAFFPDPGKIREGSTSSPPGFFAGHQSRTPAPGLFARKAAESPLKILVVLGHPNKGSFNHAIAATAAQALRANGHEVYFHDLHGEAFDPVLPGPEIDQDAPLPPAIEHHCRELAQADGIVIIHPNWWGQPPAILKGWVDRVFRPGVAYRFLEGDAGDGIPLGLLKAGTAVVFNTSNTPAARERTVFGDPLETLWENCIFRLCGVTAFFRRNFGVVVTSTQEERQDWLRQVREILNAHFPAGS
jgi:putative NADPH-quinone reductase